MIQLCYHDILMSLYFINLKLGIVKCYTICILAMACCQKMLKV